MDSNLLKTQRLNYDLSDFSIEKLEEYFLSILNNPKQFNKEKKEPQPIKYTEKEKVLRLAKLHIMLKDYFKSEKPKYTAHQLYPFYTSGGAFKISSGGMVVQTGIGGVINFLDILHDFKIK